MIRGSKSAENSWLFTKYKRDTDIPMPNPNFYALNHLNQMKIETQLYGKIRCFWAFFASFCQINHSETHAT